MSERTAAKAAYIQGTEAHFKALPLEANPYQTVAMRAAWLKGYESARDASKEAAQRTAKRART